MLSYEIYKNVCDKNNIEHVIKHRLMKSCTIYSKRKTFFSPKNISAECKNMQDTVGAKIPNEYMKRVSEREEYVI